MLTRWGLGYLALILGVCALVGIALTCVEPVKCMGWCSPAPCYTTLACGGIDCFCLKEGSSSTGTCVRVD